MSYARFAAYNVIGAIAWVAAFLLGGYFLGESVKGQLHIVVVAILVISVLPIVFEWLRARRRIPAAAEPVAVEAEQY
jgi:membrane-associated protein